MVGYKKIGHFRILCNYREILIRALEVNSPWTNTPPPHVVHKNPAEWPPRVIKLAMWEKWEINDMARVRIGISNKSKWTPKIELMKCIMLDVEDRSHIVCKL